MSMMRSVLAGVLALCAATWGASAQQLKVGDAAPELRVQSFLKGEPVTAFKPGHVYVVEFWATWCGPCIAGIPHLAELQEKYAGRATIIGVSTDRDPESKVRQFVRGRRDMSYTVAYNGNGTAQQKWFAAAGLRGIPSAFIVDGQGKIAWIGHPMAMDAALEAAVRAAGGAGASEADDRLLKIEDVEMPRLMPGSRAPRLSIDTWVKGDPVRSFRRGQVYVVEFWATWCGPCIRGFPHLTELQETYGDKVRILGVNIWDRRKDESVDAQQARVRSFVEGRSDMGYSVAIEKDTQMASSWMEAAGQNGIPAAFIVDQNGRIAWVGHPMRMDEPLRAVVNGDHDVTRAREDAAADARGQAWMEVFGQAIERGEHRRVYDTILHHLDREATPDATDRTFTRQPALLNAVAWAAVTDAAWPKDAAFSRRAATVACEATEWKDASIIDTLARAQWEAGERPEAIRTQQRAIDAAREHDPAQVPGLTKTMDFYRTGVTPPVE